MKWIGLLVAVLALGMGAATSEAAGKKFRVALILPGSENDKGWNQMAHEGLQSIEKDVGAQVKLVSKVPTSDFASQIEYFATDGYDVIICHGGEFADTVAKAAKKYPKVSFIVGGSSTAIAGAAPVEFLAGDASYLVGLVAGEVTKTKKAAFVGAMQVPTLEACYNGMKDGIAQTPAVTMLPALWSNSWDDPVKAKEKAEAAIAGGADVIYQNVDAAADGVFEAVKKANKPGAPVWAFGCNRNQNGLAPEVILGSVVIDVPRAYLELAREAKDGKLEKNHHKLGLKGGFVDLVLNDKHPAITDAIRQKVDAKRKELVAK